MTLVRVHKLFLSHLGFVVLLKGDKDDRALPICIGATEAQAIAHVMNGDTPPRPMTHDLLKNLLDLLECRLIRVAINDVAEETFYARLFFDYDGVQMEIDSRPSDAIALAMRYKCPIYVAGHVMDAAGKVFDDQQMQSQQPNEKAKAAKVGKKTLSKLEQLKDNLETAIKEERYEEAATLRDQIQDWSKKHEN